MIDLTPTAQEISLHGLGFIQLKIGERNRIHVWHPDLPRRKCYIDSDVHNHRFAFRSTVLKGTQINRRCIVNDQPRGCASHDVISHNGPRSDKGGRLSFVDGECNVHRGPLEFYRVGDSYVMHVGEYHCTPNNGTVITFMQKLDETKDFHANSIIRKGVTFDQDFDRFQLSEAELWDFVKDACKGA